MPRSTLELAVPDADLEAFRAKREQLVAKRQQVAQRTAVRWRTLARPEQLPPAEWVRVWYVRGGRGSGKTWTGSNALAEVILTSEPGEYGVVAPTFADARDVCIEGQASGLLRAFGARIGEEGVLIDKGPYVSQWNRSNGIMRLRNGSVVYADGADDGAYRIQGHNLRAAWCDEVGLWKRWKAAWDESIRYAVRLSPAKIIATGTPKRTMPARVLVKRLINDPDVVNVRMRTEDNVANLDAATVAAFMASKGTTLERQELEGELLEEVEGALWNFDTIEGPRVERPAPTPGDPFGVNAIFERIQPLRVVIAVDPAGTFGEDSDEHGIVIVARGADHHLYVLDDLSRRSPVTEWPGAVADGYERWAADKVIGETNNGNDYIEATMRAHGFSGSYDTVRATRGKMLRAEPVAQFYERGYVHHVGTFGELEEQMVSWVPDESERSHDDRIDALVYACAYLEPRLMGHWAEMYEIPAAAAHASPTVDSAPVADGGDVPQPPSVTSPPARRGWGAMYDQPEPTAAPAMPEALTPAQLQERRERERRGE